GGAPHVGPCPDRLLAVDPRRLGGRVAPLLLVREAHHEGACRHPDHRRLLVADGLETAAPARRLVATGPAHRGAGDDDERDGQKAHDSSLALDHGASQLRATAALSAVPSPDLASKRAASGTSASAPSRATRAASAAARTSGASAASWARSTSPRRSWRTAIARMAESA